MAIDTEQKRRSVAVYTVGAAVLPVSDGTVDNDDRYFVGRIYSGTMPSGAPTFQAAWAARCNVLINHNVGVG